MAELVSVVAMTHNPRIFWNASAAADDDRAAVGTAFALAAEVVQSSRPDAVIVIGNDHLDHFGVDDAPAFAVGVSDRCAGPFWYEDEVMSLPSYDAPVATSLAEDLLYGAFESGFEPARCDATTIDHAFTIPLSVTLPDRSVPVVPLFTNTFVPPLPTTRRCHRYGELLAEVIRCRPAGERIAVVGSFNLSVDVGGPKMGRRDAEFDERTLALMEAGETDKLLDDLTPAELVGHGNSTAEFLNYHLTLGVVAGRRPDSVWYRQVEGWGGCPVVTWQLD